MQKFTKNFLQVAQNIEQLEKDLVTRSISKEYKDILKPKKTIKLWLLPRPSAEFLFSLVLASKAKSILELGTSAGFSTLWLANGARINKGKVYTIEFMHPKVLMAKKHLQEAGLDKYVQQIEGVVIDILDKWKRKVDFVFIDADKRNNLTYIKKLEPYLKKNAIIVADNVSDLGDSMKSYIDYMTNSPKYYSYLLKIDNGLLVSVVF